MRKIDWTTLGVWLSALGFSVLVIYWLTWFAVLFCLNRKRKIVNRKIPGWMVDRIKMNTLFSSSLFIMLDEMFGENQWEFSVLPTEEQIESAPSGFVCLNRKEDDDSLY